MSSNVDERSTVEQQALSELALTWIGFLFGFVLVYMLR